MDDRHFSVFIEISVRGTFYGQSGVSNASFQQSTASSVMRFLKVFSHAPSSPSCTYIHERIDREDLPPFIWTSILFAAEKYSTKNHRFDLKSKAKISFYASRSLTKSLLLLLLSSKHIRLPKFVCRCLNWVSVHF